MTSKPQAECENCREIVNSEDTHNCTCNGLGEEYCGAILCEQCNSCAECKEDESEYED